jgi:hypothetical protein
MELGRHTVITLDEFETRTDVTEVHLRYEPATIEDCRRIAAAIRKNTGVRKLIMREARMTDDGCEIICAALENNNTLEMLGFQLSLNLTSEACDSINRVLKKIKTLVKLDMRNTSIGDEGVRKLLAGFDSTPALTELLLDDSDIGPDGFEHIKNFIVRHVSISTLGLQGTHCDVMWCRWMGIALKETYCLTRLDLSWTRVRDGGSVHVAEFIKDNKSLRVLDVSWCGITSVGGILIANAIAVNTTLLNISLESQKLDDTCCPAFGNALTKNTSLHTLKLGGNSMITNVGGQLLYDLLEKNRNICMLGVSHTAVTEPLETKIRDKGKENEKRKRVFNERLTILQVSNLRAERKLPRTAIVIIQKYM